MLFLLFFPLQFWQVWLSMLPVCGGVAMASAGMYRSIFFLTKNTGGKKCYTGVFLFFRKKKVLLAAWPWRQPLKKVYSMYDEIISCTLVYVTLVHIMHIILWPEACFLMLPNVKNNFYVNNNFWQASCPSIWAALRVQCFPTSSMLPAASSPRYYYCSVESVYGSV